MIATYTKEEWEQWGPDLTEVVQEHNREMNCEHDFVDARNEFVKSGEVCFKCGAIRAGNKP